MQHTATHECIRVRRLFGLPSSVLYTGRFAEYRLAFFTLGVVHSVLLVALLVSSSFSSYLSQTLPSVFYTRRCSFRGRRYFGVLPLIFLNFYHRGKNSRD
jgi:hypothetical protein